MQLEAQEILSNDYGALIINCSFQFPEDFDAYYSSFNEQSVKILRDLCKSHLVVVAAGNNGGYAPTYIEHALELDENVRKHLFVVSNVNSDGKSLNTSSCKFSHHRHISKEPLLQQAGIAAPGTNAVSTIPQTGIKQFGTMTGTSQAVPPVSGLLARLMSDCPKASITEIANLVREGANNEGPLNNPELFGRGMIDIKRTYELAGEKFRK